MDKINKMLPVLLSNITLPCLVVGGGTVARRRTTWLLDAGLKVEVQTPDFTVDFSEIIDRITVNQSCYISRSLNNYALIFACTDNQEVNTAITADAKNAGVLVTVSDAPHLSNFQIPATIRRGELIIGINTGTPGYSKKLKENIDEQLPDNIAEYTAKLRTIRDTLKESKLDRAEILKIIEKLIEPDNYSNVLQYDCKSLLKRLQ